MSGSIYLDWAILTSSLINLILLFWLGLIIFFSAEERTPGVWLVGGAALLGAGFFVAHTAILAIGASVLARSLEFWWRLGWWPLIMIPAGWYFMTLWYAGFWSRSGARVRSRHRWLVWLVAASALAFAAFFLLGAPLPSFEQVLALQFDSAPALFGVPLLLLAYPASTLLCIGLALDALRHAAPATHALGDLAHARAQPWLIATSATLLLVSLLVAVLIAVIIVGGQPLYELAGLISWADLFIAWLITLATVLVGQAVVAYETFTGRGLPRGDLHRHWRNALLLALGYGILVGGSVAWNLRPIYSLLLSTLLMTGFLALSSWRTFARHEDFVRRLRPFVAARQPAHAFSVSEIDVRAPFRTLCGEVLRSDYAVLVAVGVLAPLLPPLCHPSESVFDDQQLARLTAHLSPSGAPLVPVNDPTLPLLRWAIPLWDARGQVGVLFIGQRRADALFTQEEVETARAVVERLLDARASSELGQRLLTLQRQRLAEIRVLDQQARRVLHDEVLPDLHTALLTLGASSDPAVQEITPLLGAVHRRLAKLLRDAPQEVAAELSAGLLAGLRQVLERELAGQFDGIAWVCDTAAEEALQRLAPLTVEVAFYAAREALRNAARHGRGGDPQRLLHLRLEVQQQERGVQIVIGDDGVGMATPRPDGHGLALHGALLSMVEGRLEVESIAGQGTEIVIRFEFSCQSD